MLSERKEKFGLAKKFGSKGQSFEFSIWVAPLCKALAKFYEHRTATPISSLPSLKCAVEVFICNKYFGDKFFTRNKYFCDKPQIPWEHWHWHFLSGNLTKLLFVTTPPVPITCLCHFHPIQIQILRWNWGERMNKETNSYLNINTYSLRCYIRLRRSYWPNFKNTIFNSTI